MIFFSIITVVKNGEQFICDAIKSLHKQHDVNFEHIIIDGGSTDKTIKNIELSRKNLKKNTILFYKFNNKGLYESLNFGISVSRGKYIGLLHSDDFYKSNKILSNIKKFIKQNNNSDLVYSDILFCKRNSKKTIIRKFIAGDYSFKKFENGWHFPHTSMVIQKKLLLKVNCYNTKYKIASDYDLMIKIIKKKPSISYFNDVTTIMRQGGKSTKNIISIIKANLECRRILLENNYKYATLIILKKIFKKFFQISI
jgi:glycosyltransferase involved in cell wall biosynthesis